MLVWKGHRAKVRSLAFAPDGRRIATTAGDSRFVWLWEATTGKLVRKLSGCHDATRAVAFFPDGRHVAAVHDRRNASVWDAETGELVATLETKSWQYAETLAIPPDGSHLMYFENFRLLIWDDPTRRAAAPRRCDRVWDSPPGFAVPFQIGYTPAGTYFWRAGLGLTLFDPATRAEQLTLRDPDGAWATTAAFTRDESRAAVAFGHRAVVWRLDQLDAKPVKLRGHWQQVRAVGFLPGGGTVLTASTDGTVRLWDANTGAEQRSLDWGIGKVRAAAVSPDGLTCAAGGEKGQVVVWDIDL